MPHTVPTSSDFASEPRDAERLDLQRRLLLLVAASGTLVGTPDIDVVLDSTIRLASELVAADGHAVWRFDATTRRWKPVVTSGVSSEFTSLITAASAAHAEPLSFVEPLIVDDVFAEPRLQHRRDAYQREGIASVLLIPLAVRGEWSGTLVFYYRQQHRFSEVEVQAAQALGNLASAAMTTAELYVRAKRRQDQLQFLAQAGATLAASLDYRASLAALADMVVPTIADWCAIDLRMDDGRIERIAVAHVDPAKRETAMELTRRWRLDSAVTPGSPVMVMRAGRSTLIPEVTEEMLAQSSGNDYERLALVRSLGVRSYMCAPLKARHGTIGAITLASGESARVFSDEDLQFAEELAARAALAVENARAYADAQRANRVKDDFLATLSHELRTPLNAILGYARMLRTKAVPEERQDRALDVIERNATALTQIVGDVLDVSRIVAGKLRLQRSTLDFSRVVIEGADTVAPTAEQKQVELSLRDVSPGVTLEGDRDRLQQVIWNLLSNAIKFTPAGGHVRVRLSAVDGRARLVVEDSGVGIPSAFLPHIFEPFRQADSGPAREFQGLGLGLAITQRIVELHGGTISVESEGEGHGAAFTVSLPLGPR